MRKTNDHPKDVPPGGLTPRDDFVQAYARLGVARSPCCVELAPPRRQRGLEYLRNDDAVADASFQQRGVVLRGDLAPPAAVRQLPGRVRVGIGPEGGSDGHLAANTLRRRTEFRTHVCGDRLELAKADLLHPDQQ